MHSVLILGGYGNFGKRIAAALVKRGVPVIIAGRDARKAQDHATALGHKNATASGFDAETELPAYLQRLRPTVVVNTCGPFQQKSYNIAEACIAAKIHYIDLADGRDFVTGITALDEAAKAAGVSVISGASTVPGLSSAVIEHFLPAFSRIDTMRFGISPGQKAERGLATTQAILGYAGKPLRPAPGQATMRYGWQDIHRQAYPGLGKRWMANCDVPDIDILPARYPIRQIHFCAGLELPLLHLGLWALSWLVRLGLPLRLERYAGTLLKASNRFDRFGTADGGMHIILSGRDRQGNPHRRNWFIIAREGDGPQIPCVPAIVLASKLCGGTALPTGAYPCIGLVSLEEYLATLREFAIQPIETTG